MQNCLCVESVWCRVSWLRTQLCGPCRNQLLASLLRPSSGLFLGKMKLLHKNLEKDGAGSIVMVPEETEDMWHVFNLIAEGDSVRASTVRKVTSESNIGVRTAEKVRTTLTVRVEAVDESCFDTQVNDPCVIC